MTLRNNPATRAVRRYRRLLTLFPSDYRETVSEEWCQVFRDEYVDVRRSGGAVGVAALWLRVVFDVALSLPGAWRSVLRGTGRGGGMGSWMQELRIAVRSLARRPGFSLGVALTLGLGIGATTTIYSVVDGVMLRPLPYDDPSALVAVGAVAPGEEWIDREEGLQDLRLISMPNYLDFRERTRSFRNSAVFEPANVFLPDMGDGLEVVPAVVVSSDLFEILGVSPVLGRAFTPEEYTTGGVVMLTYGAWQRRYGGDPGVLGQSLDQVGRLATRYSRASIVGVLPLDFRAPEAFFPSDEAPEFWMPLQPGQPRYEQRAVRSVFVLGHLIPGTSVEQARAEAARIATDLVAEFPEGNLTPDGLHLGIGLNGLHDETVGATGGALGILLGAAGLLLLLAAMSAGTLLLARSLDRTQELGVRMAFGAGQGRIVRLLVSEAGVLSVIGGAFGALLAYGGVGLFLRYAPSSIPRLSSVSVDAPVLAMAAVVSLGTGIAVGLLPALALTGWGPWERLQRAGRSVAEPTSRLRSWFVGGQMAVAVVLLSGAGLLLGSFMRIRAVDPGFEPEGLITMTTRPANLRKGDSQSPWIAWDRMVGEIGAVPGVESVAGSSNLPFQSSTWSPRLLLPDDLPETVREGVVGYAVTPGYLETMRIALLQGRGIELTDGPNAESVALVNESFVRTQLGGRSPMNLIVRRVAGGDGRRDQVDRILPMRIVGVVADVVQGRAADGPRPAIYVPHTQAVGNGYDGPMWAAVRSQLPTAVVLPEIRGALAATSLLQNLSTMRVDISAGRATPRFQTMLIGAFALVATLLAAAGLYGSLAHSVGRRERELGIRMALGADRADVLKMVLGQGMRLSMAGLAVGMIASLWFTRVLAGFLYEVEPNDPATLLMVGAVLVLVSVAACLAPARRATAVNPVAVLRAE